MIIDSHAYCFLPLDGGAGGKERLKRAQVSHYLHHQPSIRLSDRSITNSDHLASDSSLDISNLPNIDFHVEHEKGRVEWTHNRESYTKYYYPPALKNLQYTPHDLISEMDYAGVDFVLLHTDPMLGRDGPFQSACVEAYPDRILSMAPVEEWLIKSDTDGVLNKLLANIQQRGLHAIKFIPSYAYVHNPEPWHDGPYRDFWNTATQLGVPIFFTLGGGHLNSKDSGQSELETYINEINILTKWIELYPDVVCSVTHGFPWRLFLEGDRIMLPKEIWKPFQNTNCSIEISFPVRVGDLFDFPYRQVWPTLEQMLDHIGPERLLWGTDMPFQNRFCTYTQSRQWIENYCDFLSTEDLHMIMGGTAARILSIEKPELPNE